MNKSTREKFSNIAYYLIIGVLSVLVMAFVPMIGSEIGMEWQMPDTVSGWIVWSVSKVSVAVINMLIFHCFQQQAKVNVKDNEHYIEAKKILQRAEVHKVVQPLAPNKWIFRQYTSKGTTLMVGTLVSFVAFTNAVLTFDILTFASLAFTLIMGAIFGYINMRKAEEYWTEEFYEYALLVQDKLEKERKQDGLQLSGQELPESSGTSPKEQG